MNTRIYGVFLKGTATLTHLVDANSKVGVWLTLARALWDVRPASGKEVGDGVRSGLVIIDGPVGKESSTA